MSRKSKKNNLDEAIKRLERSFKDWDSLYNYGGSDPFWADGFNLNLVRNHILSAKKEIEKELGLENKSSFPEIYFKETPEVVDNEYMATPFKILDKGNQVVNALEKNPDFQYIVQNIDKVFPERKETKLSKEFSIPLIPVLQLRTYRESLESGNIVEIRRKFYNMNLEEKIKNIIVLADKFRQHEQYLSADKELADEDLIGLDISEAKKKLGYWYTLEGSNLNGMAGTYRFNRAPNITVDIRTENNIVTAVSGLTKLPFEEQIKRVKMKKQESNFTFNEKDKSRNSFERDK